MFAELKKKEPLFSFQKLNKYFLLPFFIPLVCFSGKFFSETMKTDDRKIAIKDVTKDNTHTFAFLYKIIQALCQLLGGLSYFITHHISKTRRDSKSIEATNTNGDANSDNLSIGRLNRFRRRKSSVEQKKDWKIIIILLMPLAMITYNISIAYAIGHQTLEKRIYFLFFVTVLNKIVFKKQIFRHQKLALIISAIGIIPILIAFALFLNVELYNIMFDISILFGGFGFALYLILIKYLTLNKRVNVFLLLLYQGILSFIYTLIMFSVISLIIKGDFAYIYNIFHCNEDNYICISHYYFNIIMYILFNTILQLLIFLVVYHFSPELLVISDIFSPLFSFIADCIQYHEKEGVQIFLIVLGYLIIAIASFIYNELIVCNFCRLNENTWKAIDQKAYNDKNLDDTRDSFGYNEHYKFESVEPSDTEAFEEMAHY